MGRVVKEDKEKLTIRLHPLEAATLEFLKMDVKASKPSPVSPMPEGLSGKPDHALFRK